MSAPVRVHQDAKDQASPIKTLAPLPKPVDSDTDPTETLEDNRPEASTHQHLQALADQSAGAAIHDERPPIDHKNKLAVKGKKKPGAAGKKKKEDKAGYPHAAVGQQTDPSAENQTTGDAAPPKVAAPQAMKAKATSGNKLIDFMRSSPTAMSQNIGSLGSAMTDNMNRQTKTTFEAQPKILVKTVGSPDGGDSVQPTLNKAAAPPKPIVLKKGEAPQYHSPVPAQKPSQDPSQVSTSIGAKPKVKATGPANPKLTEKASTASNKEADAAHAESLATIHSNNGEERVQPRQIEMHKEAVLPAPVKIDQPEVSSEVLGYATQDLPGSVRTLSDKALKANMESQLAANDQKVEAAVAKRDLDNQQAMEAVQTQAAKESEAAQARQDAAVAQGRADISSKKDAAKAETEGVMQQYKGQVTAKHKETIDQAHLTIADHQKRADAELTKGENEAQAKKKKAEEDAARKRREAEERRAHMSFWERIGNFFSHIFSELAHAISTIVSVVTQAVTTVLETAKNLAIGILNAATKILTAMIDQFTKALKAFLSVALAAFPGIRAKLFAAIDEVVSAVKQVVDKVISALKDTLTSLIDTLSKAYAFVANAYKVALTTALAVASAIITGNFSGIPMILFRAACEAAGIPPEPVIEILKNAADAFMDIIKHPINFVKNLFKATKLGIKQFSKGLPKKLLSGLMSWLFGKLAEAGIELPKTWDLPSVFMLILKVLGLTLANVRARAAAIVGPKNMARIEFVIEQAKTLFTEGPAAVWDNLKAKATEMKDAAIQEIATWLVTKVIGGLVEKFSPPVVGAIIGAIQMIMAMIDKAKQIMQLIAAITKSMKLIAIGSLGAAANKIDSVLTQSIPVVITMAMGFLGITGLAKKVQDAILKLQDPANKAIDFIIKKFIALGKKAVGAVKGKFSKKKKGKGEEKADEDQSKLSIDAVLAEPPTKGERDTKQKEEELKQAVALVERIQKRSKTTAEVEEYFPKVTKRYGLKLIQFTKLGTPEAGIDIQLNPEAFIKLYNHNLQLNWEGHLQASSTELLNNVKFNTASIYNTTVGVGMKADPLGPNHPQGGPPQTGSLQPLMSLLHTDPNLPSTDKYIKGHLLNDNLGGPGVGENLFPITASANSKHYWEVEHTIKYWVNNCKHWVFYNVDVNISYHNLDPSFQNYINSDFVCTAGRLDATGKGNQEIKKTIKSEYGKKVDAEINQPYQPIQSLVTDTKAIIPELSKGKINSAKKDSKHLKAAKKKSTKSTKTKKTKLQAPKWKKK